MGIGLTRLGGGLGACSQQVVIIVGSQSCHDDLSICHRTPSPRAFDRLHVGRPPLFKR
jgi:hypothetical protein